MKAIRIHERIGIEGLVYEEVPAPTAVTGEVIVRVRAAGFTPGELEWPSMWIDRSGRDRAPSIPGHELAGVVTELAYGTTGLAVGDRVFGMTDWFRDGALAEYVAVQARHVARLPDAVSDIQGAALPLSGSTAWQGLFDHGALRAGQTVLIHGAGGGVGAFAVQLARNAGARVIGTGRAGVGALVRELGAESFIDVERDRFEEVGPVDLVFDTVGGELLDRSAAVVAPGGALVTIAAPPRVTPAAARSVFFILEPDRAQLTELAAQVAAGTLLAQVGATFALADTRKAFYAKNGVPGKVVLTVD